MKTAIIRCKLRMKSYSKMHLELPYYYRTVLFKLLKKNDFYIATLSSNFPLQPLEAVWRALLSLEKAMTSGKCLRPTHFMVLSYHMISRSLLIFLSITIKFFNPHVTSYNLSPVSCPQVFNFYYIFQGL